MIKIPYAKLERAVKAEMYGTGNPGFCLACGNEQDGCEPDARNYECEKCGKDMVFGAAQVLIMGQYK